LGFRTLTTFFDELGAAFHYAPAGARGAASPSRRPVSLGRLTADAAGEANLNTIAANLPPAAVVNPTFARTILRGSDAVGAPMHCGAPCRLK
jgi:hypothetical protein